MSISEITDLGVPHPWCNIRLNDFTCDGDFTGNNVSIFNLVTNNFSSTQFNIPQGQLYNLYTKIGGLVRVTDITNVTVYSIPVANGTCIYLKYYLCAKGGLPGNTNNFLVEEQSGFVTCDLAGTLNIQDFPITGTHIIQGAGFPTTGTVGGTLNLSTNNLLFQVHNTVAVGQTTDFTWCVDIYKLQTTL